MPNTTFRMKLLAVFGTALVALLAVSLVGAVMSVRQGHALDDMQGRLVPKAELGPRVEAELEHLTRSLQDAVAAQDSTALEATAERRAALFGLLAGAGPALDEAAAASVRAAVQDYYDSARDVSRRMIAGESSEALVQDISRMQRQQRIAQQLIQRTTFVDRRELSTAFAEVRHVGAHADRLRLGVAAVGVSLVFALAYWGGGSMLQAVKLVSDGLTRFGTGNFTTPIPVQSRDELASVAEQANRMAVSLQKLSDARERENWFKSGLAGLSEELRGELTPTMVAERALGYLAPHVGALAGALYVSRPDQSLELAAAYASGGNPRGVAESSVNPKEGLVGQALNGPELLVVDEPPSGYLKIRSGLGEAKPAQLLLLPLVHFGDAAGVLELALLKPARPEAQELLLAARSHLVIALRASLAGAARQALLVETQAQAQRLAAQEEELRASNRELLAQQEELRLTNLELERQRTALATQNQELERARMVSVQNAEELKRVSAYKSQFLANMSHELRTPLNSMLLLSHLMAENETGNLTPKQVEHLRTVHGAGQDLLGLINEVLDLSKIEAGKQDTTLEYVDPGHFVAFVKRLFEPAVQQRGLTFETHVDAAAPSLLFTDRQRVERILINLIGNALKFTERGKVTLSIGRPRGAAASALGVPGLAFEVSDTGVGIPEHARQRVFAPFEQVEGAHTRPQRGTGLGLTIALESARLLGGELMLMETSSAGSTFVCIVPERSVGVASTPAAPLLQVGDDAARLADHEPYLLVVEDDRVLAEQLVDIAHARQLKVVVVRSGRECLERALSQRPLGIILDVRLPDLDGWAVMERLKRDERTRSVPVHFVSGVDSPQRGLALGAVGYLVKPATHAELADMLHTLVPTADPARSVLVVEDDADYGSSLVQLLSRNGFEARHVQTGGRALEELLAGDFGGVILDLGLPDMDGLSFLRTLREQPALGAPGVVIHTGRALSKSETRELEAYAEAVVLKERGSAERLLEEARLFVRNVMAPSRIGDPPSEPSMPDVSLSGVKLLLAEDDMRTVYSLSALLGGRGAQVVTVETGKEALQALSEHPDVRCVLMDVMMPEMDGYEAMRRLRSRAELAHLPIIALTAKAMQGERERCLEAGATDYLPKPVDGPRLLGALQRALGAR
jgi:CheY-like chemotaxis protein